MSRKDLIDLLYIVAFSFFIVGLHMLRGPRTAVRGNQIAAAGMAVAVVATLLNRFIGDWILIVVGALLAVGVALLADDAGPILARILGFIALTFASINIFGGFLVTQRMLGMYQKRKK